MDSMKPEQWNQLKNEIHNKCVAYDYIDANDTTLSEFIISLIKVGKTAEQLTNELVLMVGSDYDSNVTEWIWMRKQELEASPVEPEVKAVDSIELIETKRQDTVQETKDNNDKPEKPKSRIFSQALGGVLGNGSRSERSSLPRRNQDRSRSRSRSPSRHGHRYDRSDRVSRHESSEDHHNGNVFSRIGNAKPQDRPSVFDRLGGSKASQIKSQMSEKVTEKETKKERCKYWPTCKHGQQCPYFHPTSICPDFPNCTQKASECMFIHPETSKPVIQQPMMAQMPIPCRFFPFCNNPVCPYMHPVVPQQHASFYMQSQPSFPTLGMKVQVPCKNGDACTRAGCHFLHPKDPNPQSEIVCKFDGACTRPNCYYKHTKENNSQNKVLVNKPDHTSGRQFSVPDEEIEERIIVGNSADLVHKEQKTN